MSIDIMRMQRCKRCGAPIVWIQTKTGKWMPADEGLKRYKKTKHGKDRVVTDSGEVITCDLIGDDDLRGPTGMARTPHWATCPNADDFRKGGAKD